MWLILGKRSNWPLLVEAVQGSWGVTRTWEQLNPSQLCSLPQRVTANGRKYSCTLACDCYQNTLGYGSRFPIIHIKVPLISLCKLGKLTRRMSRRCPPPCSGPWRKGVDRASLQPWNHPWLSTTYALPWSVTYWGCYFLVSFSQCKQGDTRPDPWTKLHGQMQSAFFLIGTEVPRACSLTGAIECHTLSHEIPQKGTKWLEVNLNKAYWGN